MARNSNPKTFSGILELIGGKKFGFIRQFQSDIPKGDSDPFCSPNVINKHKLRDGVVLEGTLRPGRKGDMQVHHIDKVMGVSLDEWTNNRKFEKGNTIFPDEKLNLVTSPGNFTQRVIDLVVPIGKGQRALIVAPPRTGKTFILKEIAAAITKNHPEVDLVALLVDERPEEVTDFRRSTSATLFASSNDREEDNHIRVSQLSLEYAKRLVELGRDVVILLDSLTRLGRNFNIYSEGSGRTLSGGLDARALTIPRKLFGAARNIEGGGSLTLIATALVDTGSRMDEVIFEEFKGTGNAEIVLDREMANKRIYPAINLRKSGTRNEEILIGEQIEQHRRLMRVLNSRSPLDAMQALLRHMQQSPTNEQLLNDLIPTTSDV
ncbi:MAG: transcription termination factor Rho [Bacteroidetes bacterium CG12_big_fil_rev_8_21_14_0_65_60_17]|nr:MAG: transcription termination factor Rho [Bacteroidetes bacterium CG12_big_fil_rev_8_21_14_0_65_60_17]